MDATLEKIIAWIVIILGVIFIGLAIFCVAGVFTPTIALVFGVIALLVLGVIMLYWGIQTVRPSASSKKDGQGKETAGQGEMDTGAGSQQARDEFE